MSNHNPGRGADSPEWTALDQKGRRVLGVRQNSPATGNRQAQAGRWTGSGLLLPAFDGGTKGDVIGQVDRVPGL